MGAGVEQECKHQTVDILICIHPRHCTGRMGILCISLQLVEAMWCVVHVVSDDNALAQNKHCAMHQGIFLELGISIDNNSTCSLQRFLEHDDSWILTNDNLCQVYIRQGLYISHDCLL